MPDQPNTPDEVTPDDADPITIPPHRRQVPRDEQPQAKPAQRHCVSQYDSFADVPGLSVTERMRREGLRGTCSDIWTTY